MQGTLRSLSAAGAVAAVLAVAVVVRGPAHTREILNIDEADYGSRAAYLVAEDRSVYDYPSQLTYPVALYRLAAEAFGPYDLRPVRLLWSLLAVGIALGVRLLARRATDAWGALVAALLFSVTNVACEGLSANRELPSVAAILAGSLLLLKGLPPRAATASASGVPPAAGNAARTGTAPSAGTAPPPPVDDAAHGSGARWCLLLSGACFAVGLAFKGQSLPLMLVPASLFATEILCGERARPLLRAAGLHAAGFVAGIGLLLAPFTVKGRLDALLLNVADFYRGYAFDGFDGGAAQDEGAFLATFARHVLPNRAHAPILAVAYAVALLALVSLGRAILRRRSDPASRLDRRETRLCLFWTVAALAAVSAGGRFFDHYFLFLLPSACVLASLSLRTRLPGEDRLPLLRWLAPAVPAAVTAALWMRDVRAAGQLLEATLGLGAVAAVVGLVVHRDCGGSTARGGSLLAAFRCGVHAVLVATVVVLAFQKPEPGPAAATVHSTLLARHLAEQARPGDRLVVWGWNPSLYFESGLPPGTWYTSAYSVVNDLGAPPERVANNPRHVARCLRDLARVRPRFLVEVSTMTYSHSGASLYRLSRVPEVATFVEANYRHVETRWGCRIFERRGDDPGATSPAENRSR